MIAVLMSVNAAHINAVSYDRICLTGAWQKKTVNMPIRALQLICLVGGTQRCLATANGAPVVRPATTIMCGNRILAMNFTRVRPPSSLMVAHGPMQ